MNHPVAICTKYGQVFQLGGFSRLQLGHRFLMMTLSKAVSQFTVNLLEIEVTSFTLESSGLLFDSFFLSSNDTLVPLSGPMHTCEQFPLWSLYNLI